MSTYLHYNERNERALKRLIAKAGNVLFDYSAYSIYCTVSYLWRAECGIPQEWHYSSRSRSVKQVASMTHYTLGEYADTTYPFYRHYRNPRAENALKKLYFKALDAPARAFTTIHALLLAERGYPIPRYHNNAETF